MLSTPVNSRPCKRQRPPAPAPVPAANYERKENECSGSAPLASPTGVNDFILLTASHESPSAKEKCSNDGKEICDGGVVAKEGSILTPDKDIKSGSDHQDFNVKLLKLNGDNIDASTEETCYESFSITKEESMGTPGTRKEQNDGEFELVDIDLTPVKLKQADITVTTLQLPLKPEAATTYGTPPSAAEGGCSPGCHALYDVACELDLLPNTDEKQRQQSTSDDMFCKLKASETIAAAIANTPKMQSILDEIVIVESPDEEERDDIITSTVEGMLLSGMEIMESWLGNSCTCFYVNPV